MNIRLQNLAVRVRDVLGCSSVSLLLQCSDPTLRHPLVSSLSTRNGQVPPLTYHTRSEQTIPLLQNERIHALYDMAMQTGLLWSIDSISLERPPASDKIVCSIAIAPLERPEGIIGFFLCVADQPGAFYANRCALLEQRLPAMAYELEHILRQYCEQPRMMPAEPLIQHISSIAETAITQPAMQEQHGFISLVSHELRVPLTAIKGYAGLLQAYGLPLYTVHQSEEANGITMTAEQQQHYLNVIMEQTCHMEILVNDLLDLSRLQAGRITLHSISMDIVQICQRVVQIAQQRIDTSSAVTYIFHVQSPSALPHVWADPDRVEQILTNLIDNAVKYSPDGGHIDILITLDKPASQPSTPWSCQADEQEPAMLTITVRDEGMGMLQQEQHLVLQPFVRGEHPAMKKIAGSGLGLYLSRTLVEAMHGTFSLTSQPGQGTSVIFTLPLALSNKVSSITTTLHKVMVGA